MALNKHVGKSSPANIHICSYDDCAKTFSRPSRLLQHMRTHTGERPYKCKESGCGKSYARNAHLQRHVASAHISPEKTKGKVCCPKDGCGQTFVSNDNLKKHMARLHQTPDKYKCPEAGCQQAFHKRHQLRAHKFEHAGVMPFQCDEVGCNKQFRTSQHLERHKSYHRGSLVTCDEPGCTKHFSKWTLYRKHKALEHPKVYTCEQCDKTFPRPSLLKKHQSSHQENQTVFKCPENGCSRVYTEMRNLNAHMRSYHEGRRVQCKVDGCTRTFVNTAKLQAHMRFHDPDRPLPKKKYPRKGHRRTLTGTKLLRHVLGADRVFDEEGEVKKRAADSELYTYVRPKVPRVDKGASTRSEITFATNIVNRERSPNLLDSKISDVYKPDTKHRSLDGKFGTSTCVRAPIDREGEHFDSDYMDDDVKFSVNCDRVIDSRFPGKKRTYLGRLGLDSVLDPICESGNGVEKSKKRLKTENDIHDQKDNPSKYKSASKNMNFQRLKMKSDALKNKDKSYKAKASSAQIDSESENMLPLKCKDSGEKRLSEAENSDDSAKDIKFSEAEEKIYTDLDTVANNLKRGHKRVNELMDEFTSEANNLGDEENNQDGDSHNDADESDASAPCAVHSDENTANNGAGGGDTGENGGCLMCRSSRLEAGCRSVNLNLNRSLNEVEKFTRQYNFSREEDVMRITNEIRTAKAMMQNIQNTMREEMRRIMSGINSGNLIFDSDFDSSDSDSSDDESGYGEVVPAANNTHSSDQVTDNERPSASSSQDEHISESRELYNSCNSIIESLRRMTGEPVEDERIVMDNRLREEGREEGKHEGSGDTIGDSVGCRENQVISGGNGECSDTNDNTAKQTTEAQKKSKSEVTDSQKESSKKGNDNCEVDTEAAICNGDTVEEVCNGLAGTGDSKQSEKSSGTQEPTPNVVIV